MKYIPILFSTLMVQALLAGRKTMTRRVIKPEGKNVAFDISMHTDGSNKWPRNIDADERFISFIKCPFGKVGDVLWVRETFTIQDKIYKFLADNLDWLGIVKWKPSIFMPKEACRLFLEITNIKVERLQDITSEDALSEGIEVGETVKCPLSGNKLHTYKNYVTQEFKWSSPIISFMTLWKKINGADSWNKNPWVWVIEFKQIEKPDNFN